MLCCCRPSFRREHPDRLVWHKSCMHLSHDCCWWLAPHSLKRVRRTGGGKRICWSRSGVWTVWASDEARVCVSGHSCPSSRCLSLVFRNWALNGQQLVEYSESRIAWTPRIIISLRQGHPACQGLWFSNPVLPRSCHQGSSIIDCYYWSVCYIISCSISETNFVIRDAQIKAGRDDRMIVDKAAVIPFCLASDMVSSLGPPSLRLSCVWEHEPCRHTASKPRIFVANFQQQILVYHSPHPQVQCRVDFHPSLHRYESGNVEVQYRVQASQIMLL